jgi:hypothetical protein
MVALAIEQGPGAVDCARDDVADLDRLEVQAHRAAGHARDVEQVVDEAGHMADLAHQRVADKYGLSR